jgi:hypothetical protein
MKYYHAIINHALSVKVVWKDSKMLGCGIAKKDDAVWVCCNYSPRGNFSMKGKEPETYAANVPKPTNG